MGFLLDIILLIFCALFIFVGYKRGFIRSLLCFAAEVISLFAAYAFTPAAGQLIYDKYIFTSVASSLKTTIGSIPAKIADFDLDHVMENAPEFSRILKNYNADFDTIKSSLNGATTGERAAERVSEIIASPVAMSISRAVAFFAVFAAVFIALIIIILIIGRLFPYPSGKNSDHALGAVFGILSALLFAYIFSSAAVHLTTALGSISPDKFGDAAIETSILVKLFANNNLLFFLNNIL